MFNRGAVIYFFIFAFLPSLYAQQSHSTGWDQGVVVAKAHQHDAENAVKNGNPKEVPGYAENPSPTHYYGGVTADNASAMQRDAVNAVHASPVGQAIEQSFYHRPSIEINSNIIKKSQDIEYNSPPVVDPTVPYCGEENCMEQSDEKNTSFQAAMSALNAAAEVQDYDVNVLFKGTAKSCHNEAIGYSNCCQDSGWGHDVGLAHCSAEEKKLGKNKENGLTVYVGDYCAHKTFFGLCTEYRKSYCVFHSKLARIVQTQGRQYQLHIGYGSAELPNCRGLTANEFSRLDFSVMHWDDYYKKLANKTHIPNLATESARIEEEVNALPHDEPFYE